ncbi:hypothetical protein [Nocardioides sp. TF02-7]|uniref:hypothetical protein n=1 Tax=Nocardioides sp. TF02-7 TaxID=2917724 RepID=UPI001F06CF30|nr:hypothetical protein [Nocardioides sp. TF02-7]UMG91582.1 hypothetical protein MF408_15940 [Nocardioides sp. TF02-7]
MLAAAIPPQGLGGVDGEAPDLVAGGACGVPSSEVVVGQHPGDERPQEVDHLATGTEAHDGALEQRRRRREGSDAGGGGAEVEGVDRPRQCLGSERPDPFDHHPSALDGRAVRQHREQRGFVGAGRQPVRRLDQRPGRGVVRFGPPAAQRHLEQHLPRPVGRTVLGHAPRQPAEGDDLLRS